MATNESFIVIKGIIIVRANSEAFLAVFSSCTHEDVTIDYEKSRNNSQFTSAGAVISGPALSILKCYQTTLSGTTLTVIG